MENKELINTMARELINRWDCVNKLAAIKYLKTLFPNSCLKIFKAAYELAYN